ncbi:hypothetical protein D3C78_1487280 [compost metagenome]
MIEGANPLLHAFATADNLFKLRAERDRRTARWAAQAFLQTGGNRIQPPGVGFQRVTAKRGGGIGVKQHAVTAADIAQLIQRLQHGG